MKPIFFSILLMLAGVSAAAQSGVTPANSVVVNKQTGTTYTVRNDDRAKLLTFTNGSAIAASLPKFSIGWYAHFANRGAGTVTITPASGFIDLPGTLSLQLLAGQSVLLASDGTNYFTGARGKELAAGTVTTVSVVSANGQSGSVANPTTTPQITLNNPTALVATTSVQAPFFVTAASDPADGSAIRMGNNEFLAWEKFSPGTDWTLGVNASDVLVSSAPFSIGAGSAITNSGAGGALGAIAFVVPGTGVATALGVNVGSAGGPVVNGGALGTPSSGTLTNATGLPLVGLATQATNTVVGNATSGTASPTALAVGTCSTSGSALNWTTNTGFGCNTSITASAAPISGLTGAGTGVLTALAVNVGSAGAFVTFNGAGGTPSSLTGTNISGTAASLTAGAVTGFTAGAGVLTGPASAGVAETLGNNETITGAKTFNNSAGVASSLSTNAGFTAFGGTNSNASSAAYVQVALTGSGTLGITHLYQLGGGWTTANQYVQNSGVLESDSTAGLGISVSSNSASLRLYTNTVARLTISSAGAISIPSIASSSAVQTGTLCWTTGGNVTYDPSVGCLASLEEFKNIRGGVDNALGTIMKLRPFSFTWKQSTPQFVGDKYEQFGLGAHQVESVDKRLVGYSPEGQLTGVRYSELSAVLVKAIQELNTRIEAQQREINRLKGKQ